MSNLRSQAETQVKIDFIKSYIKLDFIQRSLLKLFNSNQSYLGRRLPRAVVLGADEVALLPQHGPHSQLVARPLLPVALIQL